MPWGCSAVGVGRGGTMLSMVSRTNFMSLRFAPATANPIGIPWASVKRLRLTPLFARSVGLGPLFFPAQRSLGHCAIHAQPVPIQPVQFLKACQPAGPEFQKDACRFPFLKATMGGRTGTQVRLIESFPLT